MRYFSFIFLFLSCVTYSKVSFDFGARAEVDYTYYDDDFTQFKEGYDVRRFRFGLFTKFNDKFSTYFQTDFADYIRTRKGATQAAWIRYRLNKHNEFYLGKTEMPFSLESVSNSKYHFFMERSIASALTERYATGLTYIHYGKDWNMRVGLFGDDHFKLGSSATYGQAATARFGKKLKLFGGRMYLGASLQYREPETVQKFRTLPESHTFNARLLDTGELFFVKNIKKYGIEAMWKRNKWTLQGEYIRNEFAREFTSDLNYKSGYLIISRIFNGQRRFSFRKGEWTSTKVKKYRTWEIAARYSFLDLRAEDLNAGYEQNYAIGINYYLTKNHRFMFNYIKARATPNSFSVDETLNIYQVRFQFEF